MDALPSGTVTMLFSDIEGSTTLLSRLGDRYGEALSAQRSLLREAFARYGGWEMGTEGDSFFVVFAAAVDAVRAALAAQLALAANDWPAGVPVRVRMGLHTGEPTRHEDGYIGLDVHLAARIAATAAGGQVVLSAATRQLVDGRLGSAATLRELGSHRLKDLPAPVRLYQLVAPPLPADFPPLKSLGAPTNLPVPATPLVGRDDEVERLRGRLLAPEVRLVTLTGPGGTGKTRLAVAVAASLDSYFPAGVFFVPLAAVTDPDHMWTALAEAVGAIGEGPPADLVFARLAGAPALLVLDNLEQLAGAGDVITDLLARTSPTVVLATSRRPLRLQGEREHPVPPLALPKPSGAPFAQIAASAAVSLFVLQATMLRPGFSLTEDNAEEVAAICHRLDGLPLAIELAAARVKLLAPRALLARLGHRLALRAADSGRPSRQQTLRDTIAWSHDLLDPALQPVFLRAGVFVGGCNLDAFAAVALAADPTGELPDPLDIVGELVDASLLTIGEGLDGEPRIGMLETIREFALERLAETGGLPAARLGHAEYYAELAERLAPELRGAQQLRSLDRLKAEHDNVRAALSWLLDPGGSRGPNPPPMTLGLRLVDALAWFWYVQGHAREGGGWLRRAVELAAGSSGPDVAHALHGLGVLLLQQGENDAGRAALERSLELWRRLDDKQRVAQELSSLGVAYRQLGEPDLARARFEESIAIAREQRLHSRLATALSNLAVLEVDAGTPERATVLLTEALQIDREVHDGWGIAVDQVNLAAATLRAGQPDGAYTTLRAVLADVLALGDVEMLIDTIELSASISAELGADGRAARLAAAADVLREQAGMPRPAPDQAMLERSLVSARTRLDASSWAAETAAGRVMSGSEALELAGQPLTRPAGSTPGPGRGQGGVNESAGGASA